MTDPTTTDVADTQAQEAISVLTEVVSQLARLRTQAQAQLQCVDPPRPSQLNALMLNRQKSIECLNSCHDALAPILARVRSLVLSPDLHVQLRSLIRQVQSDIADISQIDAEVVAAMRQARSQAHDELGRIQRGNQAINAYSSRARPTSVYTDRAG